MITLAFLIGLALGLIFGFVALIVMYMAVRLTIYDLQDRLEKIQESI